MTDPRNIFANLHKRRHSNNEDDMEYELTKYQVSPYFDFSARAAQLQKGFIDLDTYVDPLMDRVVRDSLRFLRFETPRDVNEVNITISSPGGLASVGMDIHDQLRYFTAKTGIPTYGTCIGTAASAAAMLLLQGCTHREATYNSYIMCHHGSTGLQMKTEDFEREVAKVRKEIERDRKRALAILKARTKRSEEEIIKLLDDEEFLSAEEALEFGLIDRVITLEELEEERLMKMEELNGPSDAEGMQFALPAEALMEFLKQQSGKAPTVASPQE